MTKIKLIEVFSSKLCCHVDVEQGQQAINFNITNHQLKELDNLDLTTTKVVLHEENGKYDEYMYYRVLDVLLEDLLEQSFNVVS